MADVSFLVPGGALTGPLIGRLLGADEASAPLPPGTPVGPFVLDAPLGRGGSGFVYRAERGGEAFRQRVALKIVRADPARRAAAERERRVLAALRHPNIAMLIDGGETEVGELWFAMELVEGERIDDYCTAHALDWRARLRLLLPVCSAVEFAHQRLVVHRDIKPANVLVDARGEPKLLDFGIAALIGDDEGGQGEQACTPEFASPEQLRGARASVASDVYQLGRMLDDLSAVPAPRRVRNACAAIVARACAERPEARHAGVAALREDIASVLACRVPAAQGRAPAQRVLLGLRRHAAAAAIAACALLALAASAWHWSREVRGERDRARGEALQSRVANEVLAQMFRLRGAADAATQAALEQRAQRLLARFEDAPAQRGLAARAIAESYLELQLDEPAARLLDGFLTRHAETAGRERAALELLRSRAQRRLGRLDAAAQALDAARQALAAAPDEALEVAALVEDVELAERRGDSARADAARERALTRLAAPDALEASTLARLLEWRASAHFQSGAAAAAIADQRSALQAWSRGHGPSTRPALAAQRKLAWYQLQTQDRDGAAATLAAQRASILADLGEEDAEYEHLLVMEAQLAEASGRLDETIAIEKRIVARVAASEPGSYRYAVVLNNLAASYASTGRLADALAAYRESLEVQQRYLGADHLNLLAARLNIGDLACRTGAHDEANRLFGAHLAAYRGHPRVRAGDRAEAGVLWAECLARQRRFAEAGGALRDVGESDLDDDGRRRVAALRAQIAAAPRG
jgi:serine/threonine-protein kinase